MNNAKIFCLGLLLMVSFTICAQNNYADFQSWNAIGLEKKLTKQMNLGAEYEARFAQNATKFENQLLTLYAEYKLNKHIKIKSGYRFNQNYSYRKGSLNEHRFFVDVNLKKTLSRFEFKLRDRYQFETTDAYDGEFSQYPFHHLRHKAELNYNIPKTKIEPYAAFELYQSLNNPIKNGIEKHRTTFGLKAPINKKLSFEMYYRIQTRNNYIGNLTTTYILGSKISFDF